MSSFKDLKHIIVPIGKGPGKVIALDTGAVIGPEAQAMLGALHSRNPKGMQEHLKILERKGPNEFMKTFYVGYGHKSIGDLGAITVAIEGVSMLVAKAIQDFPLYKGQEVSTRYVDFSIQPFIDPHNIPATQELLGELRAFYMRALQETIPDLKRRFPRGEGEEEGVYEKAIRARAFDITRAFLPVGASTNLVWFGEIRQIGDRLQELRQHQLPEVQQTAEAILVAVAKLLPNSFGSGRYPATDRYNADCRKRYGYFDEKHPFTFLCDADTVDRDLLREFEMALKKRPAKTELPWEIRECGTLRFKFLLDFGSYRDLQRQRSAIIRMPIVPTWHGFEPWYIDELPEQLQNEAWVFVDRYVRRLHELKLHPQELQYYMPMGMRAAVRMTGDLRSLVYIVELRGTRFVHSTLRKRAIQIADVLHKKFESFGLVLHMDQDPDRFDVKRGTHDIVEKF